MGLRQKIRSPPKQGEGQGPYGLKSLVGQGLASGPVGQGLCSPPTEKRKQLPAGVKERLQGSVMEAWKQEDRGESPSRYHSLPHLPCGVGEINKIKKTEHW